MEPLPKSEAIASYTFVTKYRYISILDYILIIVLRTNKNLHEACHPMVSEISIEIDGLQLQYFNINAYE